MEAVARDPAEALRPRRLRRKKPLRFDSGFSKRLLGEVFEPRPPGGRLRAIRRIVLVVLWTLLCVPIQAVCCLLPGRAKVAFPRLYFSGACWLIGLDIRVVGERSPERPVLYVANHASWLDILVLGAALDACFVSKAEVGTWPVVSLIARLGRTVFVSRKRGDTRAEAEGMRAKLAAGDSLILFPEGTSNDGSRVLPFRSSFLAVAGDAARVQPVSMVYDRLGGLPACRRDRPLFAWYGDTDLATHFWRLARRTGLRVTVLLHEPADPAEFRDRKALTAAVSEVVAEGASQLRQNRAPTPLPVPRHTPREPAPAFTRPAA